MGDGGDYERAVVFETDEASIKEMVNAGRQQQTVFAVEAFVIGRIPPWLAMTGYEVRWVLDTCDAAFQFDIADTLFEETLSNASSNNCQSIRFRNCDIVDEILLQPTFPNIEIVSGNWADISRHKGDGLNFLSDQTHERSRKGCRDFCQIDRLEAISVGL